MLWRYNNRRGELFCCRVTAKQTGGDGAGSRGRSGCKKVADVVEKSGIMGYFEEWI
ncbi:hypothetical protein [Barnesiella viscericola]|uniref:hypothetical protein n=1 Tax=Barnesiella viscericola TaxID=397865 RepID=UPI0023573ED7|nr:hypothetical protein [Barnesiella viscericola]